MFIKNFVDEKITLFIVYVNDIIIMGDDDEQVNRLKKLLATKFKVKDFSTLLVFFRDESCTDKK